MTGDGGARRKRLGAWYTPDALVEHVVGVVLDAMPAGPTWRVLDPACGDGRFLGAVAAVAASRGVEVELVGVDVDPEAVRAASRALPVARIVHADALSHDWGDERFDVVVGNPPFLNQLARSTTRGGRSSYGGGPYADAAAEFLALAADLARADGGRVGLVLPQSIVATRDTAPIRRRLLERARIAHVWWADERLFDAAVRTCAVVLHVGEAQQAGVDVARSTGPGFAPAPPAVFTGSWAALLLDDPSPPVAADGPLLGELATFSVDFRDQYYGLVGAVGDDADGPPLVTCGLIEPGRCLWGQQPVRFAKQRYQAPRVALDRLSPAMRRWAARRLVPKILIANQTRVVEAVHDPAGAWLPGVPVITCTTEHPERVLAALADDSTVRFLRHHAAGSGLTAGMLRLSPALLASVPVTR
jgi:SAM-dependent methyltransferase